MNPKRNKITDKLNKQINILDIFNNHISVKGKHLVGISLAIDNNDYMYKKTMQ